MISFRKISNNGDNVQNFNFKKQDIDTKRLAQLFKLAEGSVYLTTEFNEVIFAENNFFVNLEQSVYYVNGDSIDNNNPNANKYAFTAALRPAQSAVHTAVKPNIPLPSEKNKKNIIYAEISVKKQLHDIEQVPLTLTEKNANVPYILKVLKDHFKTDLVLVDVRCLKINDSEHTRGFYLWKSTRKIYCVKEIDFMKLDNKRKNVEDEDEIDSGNTNTFDFKKAKSLDVEQINDKLDKMNLMIESFVSKQNGNIFAKNYEKLKSFIKCCICLDIPVGNPKVTECCNTICCDFCLMNWNLNNKVCPACRKLEAKLVVLKLASSTDFFECIRNLEVLSHSPLISTKTALKVYPVRRVISSTNNTPLSNCIASSLVNNNNSINFGSAVSDSDSSTYSVGSCNTSLISIRPSLIRTSNNVTLSTNSNSSNGSSSNRLVGVTDSWERLPNFNEDTYSDVEYLD